MNNHFYFTESFYFTEYMMTFIDGVLKRNVESITPAERRDIRAGIVEFLEGLKCYLLHL